VEESVEKTKILIVEDESIVASDIARRLEQSDFRIVGITGSGREAIDLARANCPDVIIMDVRIQGDLNGVETAIVIQGMAEKGIPVIFLTAFPPEDFRVLKVLEPCVCIKKPYREEELLGAISHLLHDVASSAGAFTWSLPRQ
jgi:DNA-binding response OmpR family regulator